MIPRTIHYCWFGGNNLTILARRCLDSWKTHCPDYEIIQWNESNFDLSYCPYVYEAAEAGKWAFVTDVVRLHVLYHYGGIYLDSDVEVLKPLDDILHYEVVSGFQDKNSIPTGTMASIREHHLIKELLDEYDGIHFKKEDGSFNMITNCKRITDTCLKKGLVLNNKFQVVDGLTLFPSDFFCAKDLVTGHINKTTNTYTVHHFAGSWTTPANKRNAKIYGCFVKIFGEKAGSVVYRIIKRF